MVHLAPCGRCEELTASHEFQDDSTWGSICPACVSEIDELRAASLARAGETGSHSVVADDALTLTRCA